MSKSNSIEVTNSLTSDKGQIACVLKIILCTIKSRLNFLLDLSFISCSYFHFFNMKKV